jgi:uncharacterized protein involved in exopolysaccharide biosynthesis
VRLVDAPSVPQARDKVFPRPVVYTVLGFVLALLVAFATGLAGVIWRGRGRERSQPPAVT